MRDRDVGDRILLVESHAGFRADLAKALERSGFRVEAFASAAAVPDGLESARYRARVLDLHEAGVGDWLAAGGDTECTIGLVSRSDDSISDAVAEDGLEILWKPFSVDTLESRLVACIAHADPAVFRPLDPILQTNDPAVSGLLARARWLARRELPICIEGEIGTGRHALAEAIHTWSPRAGRALVLLNASALLAHGAASVREEIDRAIVRARGGTLVLVDPADCTPSIQELLLSALRSAGDSMAAPRWITITRGSLELAAHEGRMIVELQYRLDATRLATLPLRDRPSDQLELCRSVARRVARSLGLPTPEIGEEVVAAMARNGFSGNRLAVESKLRSAIVRADGAASIESLLDEDDSNPTSAPGTASLDLKTLERDTIVRALAHWDGNRTRASESLGISVRTLRNKIRDYGLR